MHELSYNCLGHMAASWNGNLNETELVWMQFYKLQYNSVWTNKDDDVSIIFVCTIVQKD